ncbi:hypothetical protein BC828DRAFT_387693 [Blastocladiella britannica]|nr:hypothetical protein BC828DRAFT_387693 [Blastocladiella britannica]
MCAPLAHRVPISVIAPRSKLGVSWDIPSVVFASQTMAVQVALVNNGFVPTGAIGVRVLAPSDHAAAPPQTGSEWAAAPGGVTFALDPSTPLPASLAPGESATVTMWMHWHAAHVAFEWTYGPHADVHSLAVTLVPLVQSARAEWRDLPGSPVEQQHPLAVPPQRALVASLEALHQQLEGALVGSGGVVGGEAVEIAPRRAVSHLVRVVAVDEDCGGSGARGALSAGQWPEWWTGPMELLAPELVVAPPLAGGGGGGVGGGGDDDATISSAPPLPPPRPLLPPPPRLWFAWTLNSWRGFLPIPIAPPPPLHVGMAHASTTVRRAPTLVTLVLSNRSATAAAVSAMAAANAAAPAPAAPGGRHNFGNGPSTAGGTAAPLFPPWTMSVRCTWRSDSDLVITGPLVTTATLTPGQSTAVVVAALPLVSGIVDVAAAVSVEAVWGGDPAALAVGATAIYVEPSYLSVEVESVEPERSAAVAGGVAGGDDGLGDDEEGGGEDDAGVSLAAAGMESVALDTVVVATTADPAPSTDAASDAQEKTIADPGPATADTVPAPDDETATDGPLEEEAAEPSSPLE